MSFSKRYGFEREKIIQINDIDIETETVRIFGKGSKERIVPIGDYATESIKEYITYYRSSLLKKKKSN